jgi:hypothetical protein
LHVFDEDDLLPLGVALLKSNLVGWELFLGRHFIHDDEAQLNLPARVTVEKDFAIARHVQDAVVDAALIDAWSWIGTVVELVEEESAGDDQKLSRIDASKDLQALETHDL